MIVAALAKMHLKRFFYWSLLSSCILSSSIYDEISPPSSYDEVLICGVIEGWMVEVQDIMMAKPSARTTDQSPTTLNHLLTLRLLRHYYYCINLKAGYRRAMVMAARQGNPTVIEILLANKNISPADHESEVFRVAASFGHVAVVKRLLQDGRCNPRACGDEALVKACGHGDLEVVRVLVEEAGLDLSVRDCEPFMKACQMGRWRLLSYLIGYIDNDRLVLHGLCSALEQGRTKACIILLSHLQIPAANLNHLILRQIRVWGHQPDALASLFADGRYDPSTDDYRIVRLADKYGMRQVLRMVLAHPKTNLDLVVSMNVLDESVARLIPVLKTCKSGKHIFDIVDIIITGTFADRMMFLRAATSNLVILAQLLPRLRPHLDSFDRSRLFSLAIDQQNLKLVRLLVAERMLDMVPSSQLDEEVLFHGIRRQSRSLKILWGAICEHIATLDGKSYASIIKHAEIWEEGGLHYMVRLAWLYSGISTLEEKFSRAPKEIISIIEEYALNNLIER